MRPPRLDGLTIKAALVLGFGATFGLWLIAGFYFTQRIAEVEREAADLNTRYMRAQEQLSTVRAQVLLGSVFVRDALLDPDPSTTSAYRRQLEVVYDDVDGTLRRYVPVVESSAERDRVSSLREGIGDFRKTLLEVLRTDRSQWPTQARLILNRRIMPKRDTVLRLSDEVQALNRTVFVQQQAAVASLYEATQQRVWQSLGVALAVSLAIACLATLYVGRLERDLGHQRVKEMQNTQDLQRLSAKLVTAQEEERRTIARELHDEVGQVLMAIKVELAVVQRTIETTGGSRTWLADAQAITNSALNTVRDLSHLLHPSLLDDIGLAAAVDWYLQGFGKRHGIRVELRQEGMEERLVPDIEAAAYRIVQEALTNVAKHAHAQTCRVALRRSAGILSVIVEDDGVGFDAARQNREKGLRGLGLIGIRERVSQFGGTFQLRNAQGRGTCLDVELPASVRAPTADVDELGPAEDVGAERPETILG